MDVGYTQILLSMSVTGNSMGRVDFNDWRWIMDKGLFSWA